MTVALDFAIAGEATVGVEDDVCSTLRAKKPRDYRERCPTMRAFSILAEGVVRGSPALLMIQERR
jgi:hypothetical protein